jgi:hypothetical protein
MCLVDNDSHIFLFSTVARPWIARLFLSPTALEAMGCEAGNRVGPWVDWALASWCLWQGKNSLVQIVYGHGRNEIDRLRRLHEAADRQLGS